MPRRCAGWCRLKADIASPVVVEALREGHVVTAFRLRHGDEPGAALRRLGWAVVRPVEAVSSPWPPAVACRSAQPSPGAGEPVPVRGVVVRLQVEPCRPEQTVAPGPGRDKGVVVPAGATVPRYQRVGAYALVRSRRGLLATRHSGRTNRPGTWGLPGGGLEPGEDPSTAAVRECGRRRRSGSSSGL